LPFFLVCGCKYRGFYRTLQISSRLFANFLSFSSFSDVGRARFGRE
jgi:hypothetical protein